MVLEPVNASRRMFCRCQRRSREDVPGRSGECVQGVRVQVRVCTKVRGAEVFFFFFSC